MQSMLICHLLKHVERKLQVCSCVRGCNAEPEPRQTLRNGWKQDRGGQDAVVAEPSREECGGHLILQDDGDDRAFREAGVVAHILQAVTQKSGVLPDSCYAFGLARENTQPLADRRHGRGAQCGRENIRRGRVLQKDGKLPRTCDESARGGNCLGQRTGPNIYLACSDAEVFIDAATVVAQDASSVRIVDQ